ncbi:ABC transporter permease [Actinokineospora fastidiosa]|uniref:ABC transporter permease n=1 Tax=Actinokineospora fastidiosa TaxID=1816 RepID=UPI00167076B1|nr:ABC transporter permease [Actinokineospora fastidiosa]
MRLSGKLRSALVIGGQGIRARKLRTFLSMVSLFLGVLAVVTVQAGAVIADRAARIDLELNMGRDGTVQVYLPDHAETVDITLDTVSGAAGTAALTSYRAVVGEPGVTPVNAGGMSFDHLGGNYGGYTCDRYGNCVSLEADKTKPPGQAVEFSLYGLTGDLRQFRPFHLVSGAWLDFTGGPLMSPGLVVNEELAKGLNRYQVPAELRLAGATTNATPRIIGVVDDGNSMPTAYARSDELRTWSPPDRVAQLYLSSDAEPVAQVLKTRLTAAGAPMDQWYSQVIDSEEFVGDQLMLLRLIFLGMAALVLLIGAAGILNVGLATVGERIEEFALRRAVGTPRLLLAGIVLAETMIVGLLTAGAATGVGVLGLEVARRVLGDREPLLAEVAFPWEAGLAGVIAGVAAGVLGGLIPAIRAAKIPIATVMRA